MPSANCVTNVENFLDETAIVSQYSGFVHGIARKIWKTLSSRIDIDDLVGYGMAGLLEAAKRYNPRLGANFTTFSYYRVRGAIYDGLRGMGFVNRTEYQKIRFGERATAYLENARNRELGTEVEQKTHDDNIEELANQVSQLVTIYVTSLDAMGDTEFADKSLKPHDDVLEDIELTRYVKKSIEELPERDRILIKLYYYEGMSLEEVGRELGLSKSWICRRHAQAVENLGQIMRTMMGQKSDSFGSTVMTV